MADEMNSTVKIIQVTDLHLSARGERRFGADQRERLAACIASINTKHSDAELCVFTGDLADRGDRETYEYLKRCLDRLTVPYRLLPGNHDRRIVLHTVFSDLPLDSNGFLQSVQDTVVGRLFFLDTLLEGKSEGYLCSRRLAWLHEQLSEPSSKKAFMFMHHPPVSIGLPALDPVALINRSEFWATITSADSCNVGHIFFGHVHREVHGMAQGVPFSGQRGLHAEFELEFDHPSDVVLASPPSYGVILLNKHGTVIVHNQELFGDCMQYSSKTGEALPHS